MRSCSFLFKEPLYRVAKDSHNSNEVETLDYYVKIICILNFKDEIKLIDRVKLFLNPNQKKSFRDFDIFEFYLDDKNNLSVQIKENPFFKSVEIYSSCIDSNDTMSIDLIKRKVTYDNNEYLLDVEMLNGIIKNTNDIILPPLPMMKIISIAIYKADSLFLLLPLMSAVLVTLLISDMFESTEKYIILALKILVVVIMVDLIYLAIKKTISKKKNERSKNN